MIGGHVAVVLAAGGSSRLGRPKQLLTRDGETLARRAVRLASATAPSRLLVVLGASAEAVVPELDAINCEIVLNAQWPSGLASSLQAATRLLLAFDGPLLFLGCDQPALESRHLAALLDGAKAVPSGISASGYGDMQGVPAVVPGTWIRHREPRGDRGLGPLLRALPAGDLALIEAQELGFDIDTRQDATDAVARGWLDAFDW